MKALGQYGVLLHATDPIKENGSVPAFHCGERGGDQAETLRVFTTLWWGRERGWVCAGPRRDRARDLRGLGGIRRAGRGCSPVNTDSRTPYATAPAPSSSFSAVPMPRGPEGSRPAKSFKFWAMSDSEAGGTRGQKRVPDHLDPTPVQRTHPSHEGPEPAVLAGERAPEVRFLLNPPRRPQRTPTSRTGITHSEVPSPFWNSALPERLQ